MPKRSIRQPKFAKDMEPWLYVVEDPPDWSGWQAGTPGEFWIPARRTSRGHRDYRADGAGKGEPHWEVGDGVLTYNPATKRVFGVLTVFTEPEWDEPTWRWYFALRLEKFNPLGPFIVDFPIRPTQGSRKTVHRATFDRISKALDSDWPAASSVGLVTSAG